MSRLVIRLALLLLLVAAGSAMAERPRPLGWAMDAMQSGNWDTAMRLARRDGPVAADVIEWHRLRAGRGTYKEVREFLIRRPDWPGEKLLRKRSERAAIIAGREVVLEFFGEEPAQTLAGVLAHARALEAVGQTGEAEVGVVIAWRTLPMDEASHAIFLKRYGPLLKEHHEARLDAMLWLRRLNDARRMLPLVSDDQVKLAEARIGLQQLGGDVDTLIKAIPKDLQDHPGLAHDRMEWRARKGRGEDAKLLMLARSEKVEGLGEPAAWAQRRRSFARSEMREGDPIIAYELASRHFLTEGSAFADLEWLSGYIALRYLDDPESALDHFQRFNAAVKSLISKGRAGYWLGRAYEATRDAEAAGQAYLAAARYQTSFYGLLAAERVGALFDPALEAPARKGSWRDTPLVERDLFEAGLLLLASGRRDLAERFWTHLAETLPEDEAQWLGQAAVDLEEPHIGVMIGKRAAQRGLTLPSSYYALHPVAEMELPMAPEMVLSIARRESEFDPGVQSGVGARGLMQVMPRTGREVARRIGRSEGHTTERMITDPAYNAELGSAYLSFLAAQFRGNVVLMSAGYNAGPSRPERWMQTFGDPRRRNARFDIVDWIEHIPFRETRNYVMRVTESLPVYRARLGLDPLPIPFSKELTGSTLLPFAPKGE